jgi:hypothetical protein
MMLVRHVSLLVVAVFLSACGNDPTRNTPVGATYVVAVGNEQFAVRVSDAATAAKLDARMQSGNAGVVLGRVATGNGGFNAPWSWHLVPSTIAVADVAIEVCDGTPSYLEAHRDEWIRTVRDYCPWSAKVVAVR